MNGKFFVVLMAVSLLVACAQAQPRGPGARVSVVVLPKPDGQVGAVMVRPTGGGKPVLIDKPYVEASLGDARTVQTNAVDASQVNEEFGKTLKALPAPPTTYLIYFVEGTQELKPEAKRAIERVVADLSTRPSPEIAVVGHTDFVGTEQFNDTLSLQRALRVRELLIKRGIPEKIIQAAGRGKREPLVKTSNDVAEPRNRRVEIVVR